MANYKTEATAYELANELARRTGLSCVWTYISGVPSVVIGETRTKNAGGMVVQIQDQRGEADGNWDALPGFNGSPQPVYTTGVAKIVSEALVDVSAAKAFATATTTYTGVSIAAETVTINGVVLTARAAPANENEFLVGGTTNASATNLRAAINAHSILKGLVAATGTAGAVIVTALLAGAAGNAITVAEAQTNAGAWSGSGTALGGGAGVSNGSVVPLDLQMKVWAAVAKRGCKIEIYQTVAATPPMSDSITMNTSYFVGEFFPNEFWPLQGQV
jgi:hypothetical protein